MGFSKTCGRCAFWKPNTIDDTFGTCSASDNGVIQLTKYSDQCQLWTRKGAGAEEIKEALESEDSDHVKAQERVRELSNKGKRNSLDEWLWG